MLYFKKLILITISFFFSLNSHAIELEELLGCYKVNSVNGERISSQNPPFEVKLTPSSYITEKNGSEVWTLAFLIPLGNQNYHTQEIFIEKGEQVTMPHLLVHGFTGADYPLVLNPNLRGNFSTMTFINRAEGKKFKISFHTKLSLTEETSEEKIQGQAVIEKIDCL